MDAGAAERRREVARLRRLLGVAPAALGEVREDVAACRTSARAEELLKLRARRAGVDRLLGHGDALLEAARTVRHPDGRRRVDDGRETVRAAQAAAEDAAQDHRVLLGRAAGDRLGGIARAAETRHVELALAHDAVAEHREARHAVRRDLVHAVVPAHDERAARAEAVERLGERAQERRVGDADHVLLHASGVGERAEVVEDRLELQLAPRGRHEPHRGMQVAREEEADAVRADALRDGLRRRVEVVAERLQHVGRAALRGRGAVAVLRDRHARARCDEGGRGGHVERAGEVAARPHDVHGVGVLARHVHAGGAHRGRGGHEVVRRHALLVVGGEDLLDLVRRHLPAHDAGERLLRVHARPSRKFLSCCMPVGVPIDSGWYCTPSIGSVAWRMPITSPSSDAVALTRSSAGSVAGSTASEW